VYTTPKTFLELIKLYKSTLASKRKESQEAIDRCVVGRRRDARRAHAVAHACVHASHTTKHHRLENGLNKLHKTQSEVDVLVENARAMALDVEQKVASANVFAEQVREKEAAAAVGWVAVRACHGFSVEGRVVEPSSLTPHARMHHLRPRACVCCQVGAEKEKVNAENESAKVEADKCAAIAREVSEKQSACEADLAAAEPLVQQAEAALDTLNKKDLGETKSLKKPPPGDCAFVCVFVACLCVGVCVWGGGVSRVTVALPWHELHLPPCALSVCVCVCVCACVCG
jgi:dynein heavy chain